MRRILFATAVAATAAAGLIAPAAASASAPDASIKAWARAGTYTTYAKCTAAGKSWVNSGRTTAYHCMAEDRFFVLNVVI